MKTRMTFRPLLVWSSSAVFCAFCAVSLFCDAYTPTKNSLHSLHLPRTSTGTCDHTRTQQHQHQQSSTTKLFLTGDPGGILDFVNGLDSALGNPISGASSAVSSSSIQQISTSASASAPVTENMKISNSYVLIGGLLASLSIAGTAFLTLSSNDNDNNNIVNGDIDGVDDVARRLDLGIATANNELILPKLDENGIEQIEVGIIGESKSNNDLKPKLNPTTETQTLMQTQTKLQVLDSIEKYDDEKIDDDQNNEANNREMANVVKTQNGILDKLRSKLRLQTKEIETSKKLLEEGKKVRIDLRSKLILSGKENRELSDKYEKERKDLIETTEKLKLTETKLMTEKAERKEMESVLTATVESNRELEDRYELEQNDKMSIEKQLKTTRGQWMDSKTQLKKTQGELVSVKGELMNTQKKLNDVSSSLNVVEEEQRSLRKLGRKMWKLSTSRMKGRIFRRKSGGESAQENEQQK